MTDPVARRAQLQAIARTYVTEGLGKKNFEAIPYDDNVTLRTPHCLGGTDVPLTGKTALGEVWWAPLSQLIGHVAVLDTYVNDNLTAVACEFTVEMVKPLTTLRVLDRFIVNDEGKILEQSTSVDPRHVTPEMAFSPRSALVERIRFERLLADVSATFVPLSAEAVDQRITTALGLISVFLGADRGTLFEFLDDPTGLRATHHWVASGYPPPPAFLAADGYRWLGEKLLKGETIAITHLAELPEEASGERASFLAAGVKSTVVIPLAVGGSVLGAVTFAALRTERVWPEELVHRLQLVGEIFGTALARARAEAKNIRHLRELSLAMRVRTLGELTASLAHELRQPLTAILSNAQAAQRFLSAARPDLDEVREALTEIIADDQRADGVIRRLHALLKPGTLARSRFPVNDVVQEVVALLHSDAVEKKIEVSLELAPALPSVFEDRVQVQQVVLNLVLNGFDAICQAEHGPRQLLLRTRTGASDTIVVSVSNTGVGLAQETMGQVFEPFFTTKPEGLGMGLAICRSIIADHGGRMWITPNPDRGMTFRFTLPGA